MVVKLESLEPDDLKTLINRAIESERGLKNEVKINDEAVDEIVRMAGGDARKTLTILEAAAGRLPETKHAKKVRNGQSSLPTWYRRSWTWPPCAMTKTATTITM